MNTVNVKERRTETGKGCQDAAGGGKQLPVLCKLRDCRSQQSLTLTSRKGVFGVGF